MALLLRQSLSKCLRDTSTELLGELSRIDVLVLDDILLNRMTDIERCDLLDVIEDRYDRTVDGDHDTGADEKLGTKHSVIRQTTPSAIASTTTPTCPSWAGHRFDERKHWRFNPSRHSDLPRSLPKRSAQVDQNAQCNR